MEAAQAEGKVSLCSSLNTDDAAKILARVPAISLVRAGAPRNGVPAGGRVRVEVPAEHYLALRDDGWRPRSLARTFEVDEPGG